MPAISSVILDALDVQIALIDSQGLIQYVNQAWVNHCSADDSANDYSWIGVPYVSVCPAVRLNRSDGATVENGLRDVLARRTGSFTFDYAYRSGNRTRWYTLRAAPARGDNSHVVIWHQPSNEHRLQDAHMHEENRRLERLANTDALTRLANRLRLNTVLREQLAFPQRRSPLSVILCDIDRFKQINDTYGHPMGDAVLSAFAGLLTRQVRSNDTVGRWGGEEFLILLPDCDAERASSMAQAVRAAIAKHDFGIGWTLTSSFGVATHTASQDPLTLLNRADAALYRAKRNGRNRVEVATSVCALCARPIATDDRNAMEATALCRCT